jgi:hypothetical protein
MLNELEPIHLFPKYMPYPDLLEIGIAMQNKTYVEQPKCVLVDKMKVKKQNSFLK